MFTGNAFHKFLLLLPLAYPNKGPLNEAGSNDESNAPWNYDNPEVWGDDYSQCNGLRQSPIHLRSRNAMLIPLAPLKFGNYDSIFQSNATVFNNGHSIEMDIPLTRNNERPFVTGGSLTSKYEAQSLHFHWGSQGSKGSEHKINDRRFDVEMHIVHRNVKYATTEEAVRFRDGLTVLGIMFKIVDDPDRYYPGLKKLFNVLPLLVQYESETTINGQLTLGQFLGDLNTKQFFTYDGSLTTPPCSEAVIWNVFPDPLPIAYQQIRKFWRIMDSSGQILIDNYRPLQARNQRPIYYRRGGLLNVPFLPLPKA